MIKNISRDFGPPLKQVINTRPEAAGMNSETQAADGIVGRSSIFALIRPPAAEYNRPKAAEYKQPQAAEYNRPRAAEYKQPQAAKKRIR